MSERYFTVDQVSAYLNRSPGAIRNLVMRKIIPYRKVGGRLAFDRIQIDRWVALSEGIDLEEILDERGG